MNNEEKILSILGQMQGDMKLMQGDMKLMQGDIKLMKGDIETTQGDIKTIQGDMQSMQGDITLIQIQLKEHGGILDSLKTSWEFHKADIDNLAHQISNLSGEMKAGFKETNAKIDSLSNDLTVVEAIPGKNMTDIAHLKAVK